MEVLKKIQEYIWSKENLMLTKEDLKNWYGKESIESVLEREVNHLCSFFDENRSYEVPYNDFVLLSRIFEILKLNYREQGQVLSFILNQNAKLIESLSNEQLISYTFLTNGEPINDEKEKDIVIERFKVAPYIIRRYINEDGTFNPIDINEVDVTHLRSMIFVLSDKQIDTILFFCKKKYDEIHKSEYVVKHSKKEDKVTEKVNFREIKILRKKLLEYIDDSGNLKRWLNEEELNELFVILENLKSLQIEEMKIKIIKDNENKKKELEEEKKLEQDGILLEKIEEIKLECFNEHELLSYDYAIQIINNSDFPYPAIKEDIKSQINDINIILYDILEKKEEVDETDESLKQYAKWQYEKEKKDLIELMQLSFFELYEILDNYSLIENPYKL